MCLEPNNLRGCEGSCAPLQNRGGGSFAPLPPLLAGANPRARPRSLGAAVRRRLLDASHGALRGGGRALLQASSDAAPR